MAQMSKSYGNSIGLRETPTPSAQSCAPCRRTRAPCGAPIRAIPRIARVDLHKIYSEMRRRRGCRRCLHGRHRLPYCKKPVTRKS